MVRLVNYYLSYVWGEIDLFAPVEINVNGSSNENASYPRRISYLELNDVQMTDIGFEYLIEWLDSLRILDDAAEPALTNVDLKTVILRAVRVKFTQTSNGRIAKPLNRT